MPCPVCFRIITLLLLFSFPVRLGPSSAPFRVSENANARPELDSEIQRNMLIQSV